MIVLFISFDMNVSSYLLICSHGMQVHKLLSENTYCFLSMWNNCLLQTIASLAMLIIWEVCKERNAKVFNRQKYGRSRTLKSSIDRKLRQPCCWRKLLLDNSRSKIFGICNCEVVIFFTNFGCTPSTFLLYRWNRPRSFKKKKRNNCLQSFCDTLTLLILSLCLYPR